MLGLLLLPQLSLHLAEDALRNDRWFRHPARLIPAVWCPAGHAIQQAVDPAELVKPDQGAVMVEAADAPVGLAFKAAGNVEEVHGLRGGGHADASG